MTTGKQKLRFATWNLQRITPRSARVPQLLNWMALQNADIWVLTETHIGISPGSAYQAVTSNTPDRSSNDGERWVMIWVRDAALQQVETSDPVRTVCARATLSTGSELLIYGTVLPWLGSTWKDHAAKDGEAFSAALETQAGDWRRLRSTHKSTALTVAGDFNQDLNYRHYYGSRANRRHLNQSLDSNGLECVTSGENDPVYRLTDGNRANIDHICLDKRLLAGSDFVSWAWPDSLEAWHGLSDHFGVGAELWPFDKHRS